MARDTCTLIKETVVTQYNRQKRRVTTGNQSSSSTNLVNLLAGFRRTEGVGRSGNVVLFKVAGQSLLRAK
jgi:hypothetical protein